MQGGLVDQRAGEQRLAIDFERNSQALKPVCPLRTQMTLDPDVIYHWLTWIRF